MMKQFPTGAIFISITTSFGATALLGLPGATATLSLSQSSFKIDNFSHLPLDIQTFRDTNTQAISINGFVQSNATADALFLTDQSNPSSSQANNFSFSQASGNGTNYFGFAQSVAQVRGYQFQINSGQSFSFDFNTVLSLNTSVDVPGVEQATAVGAIALSLYEATGSTNLVPLEFLALSTHLGLPGQTNALDLSHSDGITLHSKLTSLDYFFNNQSAAASASLQGTLSRYFESPATLTLVEFTVNEASVAVPEPSSILATGLAIVALAIKVQLPLKLSKWLFGRR